MQLRENATTSDVPLISYPNNDLSVFGGGPLNSGASGGATLMNQFRAPIGAVFSAQDMGLLHSNGTSTGFEQAVLGVGGQDEAVRITQRDLWRNVRIPFLHSLPKGEALSSDWAEVSPDLIPDHSSLIGVPIRGFPPALSGNMTFVSPTNYQTLKVS
jgi:hypothetical protein